MSEEKKGTFGSFVGGLVLGTIIGGVAAILKAPRSGEDTRRMIKDKSREAQDEIRQSVDDARARAEQMLAEAKSRADEIRQQTERALNRRKAAVVTAVEAGEEALEEKS